MIGLLRSVARAGLRQSLPPLTADVTGPGTSRFDFDLTSDRQSDT
jgi:hypothetical protein